MFLTRTSVWPRRLRDFAYRGPIQIPDMRMVHLRSCLIPVHIAVNVGPELLPFQKRCVRVWHEPYLPSEF